MCIRDRSVGHDAVYGVFFHGPAYKVLERVTVRPDGAVGLMVHGLPPNSVPADAESLVAPRLLELCFQTAGIWEVAERGRLALPSSVSRVVVRKDPAGANGRRLWAVVTAATAAAATVATAVPAVPAVPAAPAAGGAAR